MPQSPLQQAHADLGARFTEFGGWTMPVQYRGVLAEHEAVRTSIGVFDVSHLGRFSVTGPGALALLRAELCNDVARIGPGRAQYTMALNPAGGVEDDIIVWWLDDETFWVMPNGTNFDGIVARFRAGSAECVVEPLREQTVLLAVQGPDASTVVTAVLGWAPGRFRVESGRFAGRTVHAAGTGYTGEGGAEIAAPTDVGEALWRALLAAGAVPCGLGARDTLRLEMGYPLWGQDLDAETTPLEAGLGWVVSWEHDFVGREALTRQAEDGLTKRLIGFRTEGRVIPRHGYALRSGNSVGTVTSGNFSPTLQCGVGLGYLSPPPGDVGTVEVEIRGEWAEASMVDPPFIDR